MKKWVIFLLTLIIALGLAACGSDVPTAAPTASIPTTEPAITESVTVDDSADKAAAAEVVRLINAIGNVTVNSESAINEAREAFNALSGGAQGFVTNVDVLVNAEGAYIIAKSQQIIAAIDAIGEVTLESGDAINAVADAYNSCHIDVQLAVTNADILEEAKKTFNGLKAAEVDALISAIGKVTLKKKTQIQEAQEAFAALSQEAAELVVGKQTLESAVEQFEQLNKEAIFKNLRQNTDKVEGVTFYHSKTEPKYINIRSYILPYIGVNGDDVYLKVQFNYTGNNWVFFEKVTIVADGETFRYDFSYSDIKRDTGYGDVAERIALDPTEKDIQMLIAIANSKETIVRFAGDERRKDVTIKEKDKQAIKDVLAAYEYLK